MSAGCPALDRALLTIDALTEADAGVLAPFCCEDEDLDDFVKTDALRLQDHAVVRTYVARYDGAVVGFISLLADAVVLKTKERKKLSLSHEDHPIIPALKIARLGSHAAFRKRYRGVGEALMRFAFDQGLTVADTIGCRLLTVDAYSSAVAFYDKLGFVPNLDARYTRPPRAGTTAPIMAGTRLVLEALRLLRAPPPRTVSMRLDLFGKKMPSWV